ncbi:MAG: acyl carrier protein [Myxococcales bacterium]|nr:acyl carrier protein [Myxococcales bacterium]MCB9569220.1 acyl carrier protein [Myxococcales bacterium]MCB9706092.1 acyl carrier protein [Myxococcales bacterium]
MTRDEIYNHLVEILVGTFELDAGDIGPDVNLFEDLDLDSIDMVDMFVEIHAITGKRIEAEVARSIRTVKDVVDLVERELAKGDGEAAAGGDEGAAS